MIRAGRTTDIDACTDLVTAFARDTDWMPKLHTPVQDHAFMTRLFERATIWVAQSGDALAGFIALNDTHISQLFVAGFARRTGVASGLVSHVRKGADRLDLWCFEVNSGALRFYETLGFQEVERTDGALNDEGLPDIRLEWRRS